MNVFDRGRARGRPEARKTTMTTRLLPIAEPGVRRAAPFGPVPHGWPGLRLGFRPFYLAAASFAVAAMALWPAVFLGGVRPATGFAPVLWQAHEMLFCVLLVV